ncbi:unnamed protein product [Auanema sp. JU1783]|nr:unnamed protein product [Auanema sp. JU1783]
MELCEIDHELVTNPIYQALCTCFLFSSLFGMVASVPIIRSMSKMSIFHPNLKMLIYFMIFYTAAYSAIIFCTMLHSFFYVLTYNSKCDLVFEVYKCIWSFIPNTWCLSGMCLTQGFISFERHISAVYADKYEYSGKRFGYALAVLNIMLPTLLTIFGLRDLKFTGDMLTICLAIPPSASNTANQLFILLIIIELLSLLIYSYDYRYNKCLLKTGDYTLAKRFQTFENISVIKLCLPLTLAHFFLTATYLSTTVYLRTRMHSIDPVIYRLLCAAVYVVPYYVAFQNLFLLIIVFQQQKEREKADAQRVSSLQPDKSRSIYFTELENQWNSTITRKK